MTSRTRHRPAAAIAAVAAAAVLGLAAGASPAAASEAGGAPGADTTRPRDAVTLTPASGPAGTTVAVRAECASTPGHGAVFSPAFAQPAVLHPAPEGGAMVAEATVRRGLAPARGYVVTANCGDAESLTTTFVTADAPRAAAVAQPAVAAPAVREAALARGKSAGGPVDGVALAFGGGLAGAALAGYVLTARRTAARRRLRAAATTRRR